MLCASIITTTSLIQASNPASAALALCRLTSSPLVLTTAIAVFFPLPVAASNEISISATPHDSYSSSIGVLGCKINTNRVAYWPMAVDCTNLCVKLTYAARSVHLLRVDQSGGAYDISYDAWNYLQTGQSAAANPIAGGGVAMTYENASASACADLIKTSGNGLPLSAANSMNFLASCLEQDDSWVGQNYVLYNIADAVCSLGYDEKCDLDWDAGANQATCTHQLGSQATLTSDPVYNIRYPTGEKVLASTGEVVGSGGPARARVQGQVVGIGIALATGLSTVGFWL